MVLKSYVLTVLTTKYTPLHNIPTYLGVIIAQNTKHRLPME